MAGPRDIGKEIAELDRAGWRLWIVILIISASLAAGIVVSALPTLNEGIVQIGTRHIVMLPQLLAGLITLTLLAGTYVVFKQRELNRMRDFILATHTVSFHPLNIYPKDGLTGTFDRKGLPEILDLEASKADHSDSTFSIVHCDIRDFGKLNSQQGNLAGDRTLQEVARVLQATVRAADIVIRYGPDEFLCVLPATNPQGGATFIRRAEAAFRSSSRIQDLTIDFGLATYRHGTNLDKLLGQAEEGTGQHRAGAPVGMN